MTKPVRVYISFDFEHDLELKNGLVAQLETLGFGPNWIDQSIQSTIIDERWQTHARQRIGASDLVLVICGRNTSTVKGIDIEYKIARQMNKPVRFLRGRQEGASLPHDVGASDRTMTSMAPADVAGLMSEFRR